MDAGLIPPGLQRCSFGRFLVWLGIAGLMLAWSVFGIVLCLFKGLNQTNMNNAYGFALWIWADLAVIALGGGAFMCGLLRYIFAKEELSDIVNYTVVIGIVCYFTAMLIIFVDVGQPLRMWFLYWHANVHSMLTEVGFCISVYFAVLCIEYLPLLLENRKLDSVPFFHALSHNMHITMPLFAATGVFLSFFHQGSLGGVPGVLFGRPFAFREGLFIWPSTFFLFIWSAAGVGPCFTLLITRLTEKITNRRLVTNTSIQLLAKIAGWTLLTYIIVKIADTLYWSFWTAPSKGMSFTRLYTDNAFYGTWILIMEIGICGLLPPFILIFEKLRSNRWLLMTALILAILGMLINRWVMVLQVMAIPMLTFEPWYFYFPSWQEVAVACFPFGFGAFVISLSYRYLPLFPREQALNSS